MSPETLAVVDRIYKTFETRDFATFFSLISPQISVTQCPDLPWGGVYQGVEAAKAFFGKLDSYLDNRVVVERIIGCSDRVAVIGRTLGTARNTGRAFDVSLMHLWEFQDGLAARLEIVLDGPTMLAALAL